MSVLLDRIESHLPHIVEPVHKMVREIREGLSRNLDPEIVIVGEYQYPTGWWTRDKKGSETIHHHTLLLATRHPDKLNPVLKKLGPIFGSALPECEVSLSLFSAQFPAVDPVFHFLIPHFEINLGMLTSHTRVLVEDSITLPDGTIHTITTEPQETETRTRTSRLIGDLRTPIFYSIGDANFFLQDPQLLYGPGILVSNQYTPTLHVG